MGSDRASTVRYEDIIEHPQDVTRRILSLVGAPSDRLPFVDERTADIVSNHTAWGNRSRFATGEVRLQLDDSWRREQGVWIAAVTALTSPRLGRYGYRLSPRSRATFREPRTAH